MQTILTITRTSLSLAFLLYASICDYKTREVSNSVWILFAPTAFSLTLVELLLYETSHELLWYGVCFGLTATFAVILFYSGGFGGADAKALMCLALALPFYPQSLFTPISGQYSLVSQMFFPITVFSNSVVFAAATAVYIFLRNMFWHWRTGKELFEKSYENASLGRKFLVLITGYKVSVDRLKEKWHLYPMEDAEQDAENMFKRKLVVIPKDDERKGIVDRLAKAVDGGKIQNSVWATPGLPMLIFITAGLVIALLFGDIVWICIRLLLG